MVWESGTVRQNCQNMKGSDSMISEIFDLNSEINRLVRSQGTDADKKKFKEGLEEYIRFKQRNTAMRILERIYNNDRQALRKDAKPAEMGKISLLIGEDASVEEYERKKMLGILYPMLQEEIGLHL